MSVPSDKAVEAARPVWLKSEMNSDSRIAVRGILWAAHDAELGLDRSVCLRDVVDAIAQWQRGEVSPRDFDDCRLFIEHKFGDGS